MKIKRYNNIYGKNDNNWLKIIIIFVAVALLVFLIFSIADPIAKLFSGNTDDNSTTSSEFNPTVSYASGVVASQPDSSTDATTSQDATSETSSEVVVVRPDRTEYTSGLSVTLDVSVINNAEKFSAFIENAVEQGVGNVIIELKDADGYLYYNSSIKAAKNCKAISSNAVADLSSAIAKLRENNICVTAKIHCFKDKLATEITDAAVKQEGENGGKWLDDTKENGGKPWLNPYSDSACNYLLSIVKELTDMGVDNIMLASLQFPTGHQRFAYYGYDSDTVSRDECLSRFVAAVKKQVEYAGSEVWVEALIPHYLEQSPEIYGTNPFTYPADCVVVNLVAEDFGNSIFINNTTISNPTKNYRDLIRVVVTKCQSINTEGVEIIPLIQTKGFEAEDVQNQIKETKKYAATRYALVIDGADIPSVK